MPRRNKIAITCIFGLGIFDIGVGVARLVTVLQVDEEDFTWTQVPALIWLSIEPSIAIIVACLCVCRPLMEELLPKRWRRSFRSTSRLGEDHIKLVGGKNGTAHSSGAVGNFTGAGSTGSQNDPEEVANGAVHVRKDIIVSADQKV